MFDTAGTSLSVSGASVVLKPRYPPHLATRKIYDSTFFRDEQYQHEIANHYRDYKQRPRIRRRRRNVYVRHRKAPITIPIGADPFYYRDEMPIAVHDFSRFALVYTPPRGRQCECESQPPDETYNDNVRQIRAANSYGELKALVQRQIAKRDKQNEWRQHIKRIGQGNCQKIDRQRLCLDKFECDKKQQAANAFKRRPQQRHSLGNIESGKQQTSTQSESDKVTTTTTLTALASTEQYLQFASEHYEREYLANVKFLESIPERSALIRARGKLSGERHNSNHNQSDVDSDNDVNDENTLSASCENYWNHSRPTYAKSNASPSTDERSAPKRRTNYGIAKLLRLIGRKRSFRIGSNEKGIKNWAIRVNITPAAGETNKSKSASATKTGRKHSREDRSIVHADSMHDFLNANANSATATQIFQSTTTTTFNSNNNNNHINNSTNGLVPCAQWSTEHLHNIIENLSQLDLNALNARVTAGTQNTLVPRITLTDYCDFAKSQYNEGQVPTDFIDDDQQALKHSTSACDSAIPLKPTKFSNKTNLDLPSNINYQSEARPP